MHGDSKPHTEDQSWFFLRCRIKADEQKPRDLMNHTLKMNFHSQKEVGEGWMGGGGEGGG